MTNTNFHYFEFSGFEVPSTSGMAAGGMLSQDHYSDQ